MTRDPRLKKVDQNKPVRSASAQAQLDALFVKLMGAEREVDRIRQQIVEFQKTDKPQF